MGRPKKAKRKGWIKPPSQNKERPTCKVCRREYTPNTDNTEADTCRLCQLGLTNEAKILKAPQLEPEKTQEATIQPPIKETAKTTGRKRKKKLFWIECRKCDKFFWSTSKVYNRICPSCTDSNANISILAIPNSQGKISDNDD
jgi:hypothetical protein